MTKTYKARAFLDDDGWWTVEVPELTSPGPDGTTITATGSSTTARGIDQAARELVAVWLGTAIDDVDVETTVEAPADVLRLWEQSQHAEAEGRAAVEHAAALRRQAVRTLRTRGFTHEAAAAALGISRQRVQQLSKAS